MNTSSSSSLCQAWAVAFTTAAVATLPIAAAAAEHENPAQLVAALHSAFGEHHVRAVHSKGIILEGRFAPTAEARKLSHSSLFAGATLPITVRFSDFTGLPDIPDTASAANPRGFAVKFHLADGVEADVVNHSFNGFPTANADEFAQLLRALGASGPDAPKPTALDRFLGSHPIAATFLTTQKPAPVSYASLAYFGVTAFAFTDAHDRRTFVRYRFVPKGGEHLLDADALRAKGPNYLQEEIAQHVAAGPFQFDWYAQVAGPGDIIDNPSIAWPEARRLVKLGTLTIDRLAPDQPAADKALLFLPSRVPAGIEPADPMIAIRSASYPISFGERQ